MGQKVGYIRVSSKDQNLDRQIEIMHQQGVEKIFKEKKSGKNTDRPEFKKMMDYVREGDTLVIESYSRLARSTKDLLTIVDELEKKGVNLISIKEDTDTTTPTGKLLFTIMAGIAQFEREIMLQRQEEGIREAMKAGKTFGRPKVQLPENFASVYGSWKAGQITAVQAMKDTGLTRATFYRLVKEYEAQPGRQLTLGEKWALDGIPHVTPPTEETLAWAVHLREEESRKVNRIKNQENRDQI